MIVKSQHLQVVKDKKFVRNMIQHTYLHNYLQVVSRYAINLSL